MRPQMAQPFRSHLHAGRVSMKYSRRSKRGGRRIEEVKCSDASMVRTKEDFMKIIGLKMRLDGNDKEEDVMLERKTVRSTASLRIRECSVVIVGENCKICGLLFKSTSDVIFHTKMRHGDGFSICGKYIKANMAENKEKSDPNVRRRRASNDNGNKLRVKIKIGDEIISEISMNRKHLNGHGSAVRTKLAHLGESNVVKSTTLKNDYKSSVLGIDSFVSSKNHCDDYVMNVQPLNRTHQRAHRDSLLLEGSRYDGNSNYLQSTRGIEDSNSTIQKRSMDLFKERLPPCNLSLQRDVTCNNNKYNNITNNNNNNDSNNNNNNNDDDDDYDDNNNNDNNNNSHSNSNNKNNDNNGIINHDTDDNNDDDNNNNNDDSNIRVSLISECNMSDKENESERGQRVKNVVDDETSVQGAGINLPLFHTVSDDDEIQEILRITRRRCTNSHMNIKRKLEYSVQKDSTLPDIEGKFVEAAKKTRWSAYASLLDVPPNLSIGNRV